MVRVKVTYLVPEAWLNGASVDFLASTLTRCVPLKRGWWEGEGVEGCMHGWMGVLLVWWMVFG